MNHSFINLISIQFREFVREPEVLFWSVLFPLALSGLLGLAFANQGTPTYPIAIVENSATGGNASVQKLLRSTEAAPRTQGVFGQFTFRRLTADEAFLRLRRGEVAVVVEPGAGAALRYHFDPQNEEARAQYLQLEKLVAEAGQSKIEAVQTQGSRYIDFLIPGMLAYGIMNSCVWGIGWSLIELRIRKLLRRIVATPLSRAEFLLAQFTVRLLISLFEVLILFVFAYLFFGIRIQGGGMAALAVFLASVVAFGGIAILVAARPEKTAVGNGVVSFITLSMLVLSGIFFNYTNFPAWAVSIIRYLPLTLSADALRGVFNEGLGLIDVAPKLLLLLGYGAATFTAGLKWFKWY